MSVLKKIVMVRSSTKIDPSEPRATLRIELPPDEGREQQAVASLHRLLSKVRVSLTVEEKDEKA